jgi:hypothetical protein
VGSAAPSLHRVASPVVHWGVLRADSVRFTLVVCEYLEEFGVGLPHDEWNAQLACLDVNLRHQDCHQPEFEPHIGVHGDVQAMVTEPAGTHTPWRHLGAGPRRSSPESVTFEEGSRKDP